MRVSRTVLFVIAAASITTAGCVVESPLSVRRVWADFNTLNTPAVYYEKVSHLPMDSARVKELRWMYNAGPHETGPNSLIPAPKGTYPRVTSARSGTTNQPPLMPPTLIPIPKPSSETQAPIAIKEPRTDRTARRGGAWRFIH